VATAVAAASDLPTGSAKGSLTYDGATGELKFAAAFVDQKDERNPFVLVISDQKLPVQKWESEFDMMMDDSKWSGVVFFLSRQGRKIFSLRRASRDSGSRHRASQETAASGTRYL
jgi:hypothetical protein